METISLGAQPRAELGTRAAKKLRAGGWVPAVIYGHGEPPEHVSLSRHDVDLALLHEARMIEVAVNGRTQQYLIKQVQYDHLGTTPVHLDLVRVALDERVRVRVGIELRGTPRGVAEGGLLEQHMADIEVECLAGAIPDRIRPLVTELQVGQSLFVKDLQLPPEVVVLAEPDDRVATVREMLAPVEPEAAETSEEAAAEPERIARARKEGEDEEK